MNLAKPPALRQPLSALHGMDSPLYGQAVPPLESSPAQNGPPIGGTGTGTKSVNPGAASFFRLVSSFRHCLDTLQSTNYRIACLFTSRQLTKATMSNEQTPKIRSNERVLGKWYNLHPATLGALLTVHAQAHQAQANHCQAAQAQRCARKDSRSGGMVDAPVSKTGGSNPVSVRIRPSAPKNPTLPRHEPSPKTPSSNTNSTPFVSICADSIRTCFKNPCGKCSLAKGACVLRRSPPS